jgi:hypothetical protein
LAVTKVKLGAAKAALDHRNCGQLPFRVYIEEFFAVPAPCGALTSGIRNDIASASDRERPYINLKSA